MNDIDKERAEENFRRLEEALQSRAPVVRQPHLGYGVAFAASAFLLLVVATLVLSFVIGSHDGKVQKDSLERIASLPRMSVYAMGIGYLGTLVWSFFLYPHFWKRPYFDVLQWNFAAVRRYWPLLLTGGVGLSVAAGIAERFVSVPDTAPMNAFFKDRADLWLITIFGSTVAPFFEEMMFRGYFLPGVAIAFDWLRLERSDAARAHWESSSTVSLQAVIFSGIFTSIGFAALHASQLANTWGAVFLLFCVSCVLTSVRVRLNSLAASTLLHASYNATLFMVTFIATGGYQHLEKLQH
ncbi:CPBP family intramembrane glutamic endopeptidase [Terriglobus albidus]|uniref:CPBP family intramembrane glutamic endopeptidase n=1 Tax=Terriglobus albidus TaxID=1592106 RepID=UPI0021E00257|nr:CPBP family intramembrane glutamic endopeptidase [Terriglobus albidus]